jgi:hypothetical protein
MMNPNTKSWEELFGAKDVPGKLLRPDGEPVPDHWLICGAGDLVTVERGGKIATFRVGYIGDKVLVLEPADPVVGGCDMDLVKKYPPKPSKHPPPVDWEPGK